MGQIVADGSACGEAVISPLELQEGRWHAQKQGNNTQVLTT